LDGAPNIYSRALAVLGLLIATLAMGIVLLVFFEPDVQGVGAQELVERKDDARAFLAGDYVFVLLYAVLSPLAIWRFGSALGDGDPAFWIELAAGLLVAAGLVDLAENTLLITSTGSVSEGRVDAAQALEIPKVVLFTAGALATIAVNVRAAMTLRERRAARSGQ
jgi:hypothetical protein